jgi:hypothetical protein
MANVPAIMQDPSIIATLAKEDPRYKKIIEVLNTSGISGVPDLTHLLGAISGGKPTAGTASNKSSKVE